MVYNFIELVNLLDAVSSVKIEVKFGEEHQVHEIFRVIGDSEVNYKINTEDGTKYFRSLYETLIYYGLNPYSNVGPITITNMQESGKRIPPRFNYITTKEKPVEKFVVEETEKPTATEMLMSLMKSIMDR